MEEILKTFERFVREHWEGTEPCTRRWFIAVMGLPGEVGEVTEHMKKLYRDGKDPGDKLLLEFGDALHYLTALVYMHGYTLDDVAAANMDKLRTRWGLAHKEGKNYQG